MTDQVLHCGGSDWAVTGYIIVGGYYTRVKKPLSSQCLRIKWQDTTGHAIPSSFFFQIQKQTNKKNYVDSQVWLKNCEWQVLIGRFGSVLLPSRFLSSFFFPRFIFYVVFFFFFHIHTLVKFVADRFSPSPTMQLTSRKRHLLLQYVHTNDFFVQRYQRGARQKWFTPRERKKTGKKKKYKYLCPAVTLHKWKKDWHWIQKYHNFYISNCLCWLLFRNTLISQESLSAERISIFNLLVFLFWLPLAVPIVQRTLHRCKHDLSWAVQRFGWTFCFFFTLQNYTSIHIFSSLNSCF